MMCENKYGIDYENEYDIRQWYWQLFCDGYFEWKRFCLIYSTLSDIDSQLNNV